MCATVADASVFIWGKRPEGELITVPAVEAELKDIRARSLLHIYQTRVESPTQLALKAARAGAEETGDIRSLSAADLEVLAKALECKATLATDDYALQNVALHLGLKISRRASPDKEKAQICPEVPGLRRRFEGKHV